MPPPGTEAIGFPLFDAENGGDGGRDVPVHPALAAFLERGPPPIVFTLGSFVVHAPGAFYVEAAEAAYALGRRAVLLTGELGACRDEGDILTLGYAPHSQLFDRAVAVVHHGGIGTTGQAMRAGVPQMVVPFFGDQFDNAARITRLGIGSWMRPADFRGDVARDALARLLNDPAMVRHAKALAAIVRTARAAEVAADRIVTVGQSAMTSFNGKPASPSRLRSGVAPASTIARPWT